jgi:hypothetical protein
VVEGVDECCNEALVSSRSRTRSTGTHLRERRCEVPRSSLSGREKEGENRRWMGSRWKKGARRRWCSALTQPRAPSGLFLFLPSLHQWRYCIPTFRCSSNNSSRGIFLFFLQFCVGTAQTRQQADGVHLFPATWVVRRQREEATESRGPCCGLGAAGASQWPPLLAARTGKVPSIPPTS